MERLQEAMKMIPKVDMLAVQEQESTETIKNDDPESFMLNGPLMLHIIGKAPDILLQSTHCTAQDLMDAFKTICESNNFHDDVYVSVVNSALDGMLALAEEEGFQIVGPFVNDYTHGYAMVAGDTKKCDSARCTMVSIHRIDADGKPIFKKTTSDSASSISTFRKFVRRIFG